MVDCFTCNIRLVGDEALNRIVVGGFAFNSYKTNAIFLNQIDMDKSNIIPYLPEGLLVKAWHWKDQVTGPKFIPETESNCPADQ
ncbi:unnamed protein product [Leptidea sinapis]|uniref:Uncharacterized protein n=1 Tax=Leptidea sinapis TaxID=189913 RepID=A0A5E4QYF7_9NEOP|nr:unnamed protein product [Leptidea sinapis]